MVIKETRSDKIFNFINYFLLACVFLICLYPLWFIIIASISNPDLVNGGQVWFWPKDISFDGYKSLFADDGVMRGYVIPQAGRSSTLPLRCPLLTRFPAGIL